MATVQFTIGFLDDESNCVGDVSAYPPVFLQYRQHENFSQNDQWITEWNTSELKCKNISIHIHTQ